MLNNQPPAIGVVYTYIRLTAHAHCIMWYLSDSMTVTQMPNTSFILTSFQCVFAWMCDVCSNHLFIVYFSIIWIFSFECSMFRMIVECARRIKPLRQCENASSCIESLDPFMRFSIDTECKSVLYSPHFQCVWRASTFSITHSCSSIGRIVRACKALAGNYFFFLFNQSYFSYSLNVCFCSV